MFRIGQKVVCVDNAHFDNKVWIDGEKPHCGAIYTISDINPNHVGQVGLQFVELKRTSRRYKWYFARRFRPVVERKTDISIFQAMLTPSPVTVDASI